MCESHITMNKEENNAVELNIISAVDKNMGIGKGQELPWRIPSEFKYFLEITTKTRDKHGAKYQNAVILGRRTWETMDAVIAKPHPGALNIVLSRFKIQEPLNFPNTIVCASLEKAVHELSTNPIYRETIDTVWVLGGAAVYKAALQSPNFHRLYLSRINATYPCDVFFPTEFHDEEFERISKDKINDKRVPVGVQKDLETGIEYEVYVYEKKKNSI